MRHHKLLVAMAVLVSATLINAAEAGQRQRSPGHGGGHQGGGGGGSDSGRTAAPREDRGGGGERSGGQDRGAYRVGGQDRGGARAEGQERGGYRPQAEYRGGAREDSGARREAAAPPTRTVSPAPESDARVESRSGTAVRRVPNRADISPRDSGRIDGGAVLSDRSTTGRAIERRDIGRSVERNGAGSAGRVDSRSYSTDGRYSGRVAIPRVGPAPQRRDGRYAYGGRTYVDGGRYYTYAPRYYYSPRYYSYRPYYFYRPSYLTAFSFGFGPRGRGFFYFDSFYDSYVFYPRTIVRYGDYGRYGYATGTLRLDVEPRDAQVYIDGAYAGLVDDFDGVFQSLRLEAGEYQVEIVLPGFETLAFDVRIFPGEKTTYRGDLIPERP